jgi:hypothetical protein
MDAEFVDALTWRQLDAFLESLLDAYVVRDDFDMLLTLKLERPGALTSDGGFKSCIYKLVVKAKSEGWLPDLVNAVMEDRARNAKLKRWAHSVRHIGARLDPPPAQQLLDTAYFDLGELRRAVARARKATRSRVLGFGVTCSESIFVRKLADWLGSYLGETQVKEPLNLMPELAPVSTRLRHIARYRPELDSANILCIVQADGTPADMVAEFWQGVCREFDGIRRYLVLILTGSKDAIFPKGVTVLPRPQFDVSDIDLWTRAMVRLHGWPVELADAWTDQLREESTYQNVLDVRLLYEAMDGSVRQVRFRPDDFRRQLEEKTRYGHATPT